MAWERMYRSIDDFLSGMEDYASKPAGHFCAPEAIDGVLDGAIVAGDGSLMSMLRVNGALSVMGSDEYAHLFSTLQTALANPMDHPGHALAVYFTFDPYTALRDARAALRPSVEQGSRLGMDVEALMDDWSRAIARYTASESVVVCVWTTPEVLPRSTRKAAGKQRVERLKRGPQGARIMTPDLALEPLRDNHRGFVHGVSQALSEGGLSIDALSANEAVRFIREAVQPRRTPADWKPHGFGEPVALRPREAGRDDDRHWMYARLREQIFDTDALCRDNRTVEVGGMIHNPVAVTLPPLEIQGFQSFFARLCSLGMPWRLAILIEGDGLNGLGIRHTIAKILYFSSTDNKKFSKAADQLRRLHTENVTLVKLRMMADTWIPAEASKAEERLRRQADFLVSTINSWGSATAMDVLGDPLLGFSAASPGLMRKFPTQPACAPIADVLPLLPFSRPVSVWKTGSWPLRSADGKLQPYAPGSSHQASWIDLGFAPMGSGKSVALNALNLAFLLMPGLPELPYLTVIDIGPSSRGVVSAMQTALPENRRHLAVFARLRMDSEYAINVCDTELGCPQPTILHEAFLVNLISVLATDPLTGKAPGGLIGLIKETIRRAYAEYGPDRHPKPYEPGVDGQVDEAVARHQLVIDEDTSWWELVKALFEAGEGQMAARAQRHAVPLLTDIGQMATAPEMDQIYGKRMHEGEKVTHYLNRVLTIDLASQFPILTSPTQFDVREAKVVALDLDEVAPKGTPAADHQTAVMYMVARFAGAQKFFLQESDTEAMPEWIRPTHWRRIRRIRELPKRLCFDELHRVTRQAGVASQIVADVDVAGRESRKWNIHIGLYTQRLEDFPDSLVDLASSILVFGAGNPAVARRVAEKLGLSRTAEQAIARLPQGPSSAGSSLVGVWSTDRGRVISRQMLTLGPMALWAFSSTAEDVALRTVLYGRLGVSEALRRLAARYPGGVKKEIERRRIATEQHEAADIQQDLVRELMEQR